MSCSMTEPRGDRSWRRRNRKAGLDYGATVSRWNVRCDRSQCGRRQRDDAPTNGPVRLPGTANVLTIRRTDDVERKERRIEWRNISLNM